MEPKKDNFKPHIHTNLFIILSAFAIIFLFAFFVWGQINLPGEVAYGLGERTVLDTGWEVLAPEGYEGTISLPTKYGELNDYKTVIIKNTLPDNPRYNAICLGNYGQDTYVYIDGELRYSYNENSIHMIGTDRPVGFLFIPIYDKDSGAEIVIMYERVNMDSRSELGVVIVGSEIGVTFSLFKRTVPELAVAFFLIIVGVIVSLIGFIIKLKLKTRVPIIHLGVCVILSSFWLICNSTSRQFLFPNMSIARNCAFLLVALIPIPFALFFDALQHERYHLLYHIIIVGSLACFTINFSLNALCIKGLSELYIYPVLVALSLIPIVIFTVTRDFLLYKTMAFYRLSAIGSFIFSLFAVFQIISYMMHTSEKLNGIFLGIGLLVISVFSSAEAVMEFERLFQQHKEAVMQVDSLSREALETIAKTVDAKDPYTLEHSTRVSMYAGKIAKELGWLNNEVDALEKAALLHDIGKIGIPDSILNKPARLTDKEFDIIKSHPQMGAEIVKNISSLKYAHDVALYHHEKYDGSGYPSGLSGKDIPEVARIVCIADSFDAMHSKRVYRNNLDMGSIKDELLRCRGTQFDPDLLDIFMTILEKDEEI